MDDVLGRVAGSAGGNRAARRDKTMSMEDGSLRAGSVKLTPAELDEALADADRLEEYIRANPAREGTIDETMQQLDLLQILRLRKWAPRLKLIEQIAAERGISLDASE